MASVSTTEHDLKYEPCDAKNLGQGNFGTAKLMRLRSTGPSVIALRRDLAVSYNYVFPGPKPGYAKPVCCCWMTMPG